MNPALYPVFILLVDAIAIVMMIRVKLRYEQEGRDDGVPIGPFLTLISITAGIHLLLTLGWFSTLEPYDGTLASAARRNSARTTILGVSTALGAPATLLFTFIFVKGFTHASVDKAFGINTARPPETDFSQARAQYLKGDTEGALRMCREYFHENPETPRALFEADRILTKEDRPEEAADILREVLRAFKNDDGTWIRAAFRMADIQENEFDDRKAADYILGEIEKRVPDTDDGLLARRRRARVWDTKGVATDPKVS